MVETAPPPRIANHPSINLGATCTVSADNVAPSGEQVEVEVAGRESGRKPAVPESERRPLSPAAGDLSRALLFEPRCDGRHARGGDV